MSDDSIVIPEGYEVVRSISTSGSVTECVAQHKADETLVRLRVFDFTQTSGPTTRRHYREHLRCDITFMEELEHPGIIRLHDYSDTRNLLWIATQPAEIDRLSERFAFLAERPFECRHTLVNKFLTILQRIHNSQVVHRNLCSDSVFLTPEEEIYIGDFSFAGYLTDRPTMRIDATPTLNTSYLPPEVKGAETYSCDVSSDIFSAGLLAFEILFAASLPKNAPHEIDGALRVGLSELVSAENIGMDTADVILRAANAAPEKRWPSAEDFADALTASLRGSPAPRISTDQTATIAVTEPVAPPPQDDATVPIAEAETAHWPDQIDVQALDDVEAITPLDSKNEIWNNHYEILEKIGEGGQAVVYKAYDHLTNEEIAIKTIWSRHRGDRAAINRLKQGAMIARSLTHRHIIKTYSVEQRTDADSLDRQVFIVMELIDSKTDLGHAIEMRKTSEQKFRLDETLHIINQLLDALSYAHEHTIHRDIKPGNIMLVPRDKDTGVNTSDLTKFDIKLIDFGIAKVLSQKHIDVTGKGFRSAYYGAPELADARVGVDARADVFSVGVMLYQMLTGEIPRKGSPPANKVNKEVPAALAQVIDQSINMDRDKRYKSTSEFTKEIEKAVGRFNWVRKAAKIAVVLLACAAVAGAVERLLPEPNYGSVEESINKLASRDPNQKIATLADNTEVKYADIESFGSYDQRQQAALVFLRSVEMSGNDTFDMRKLSPWREQERVWRMIEPDIEKVRNIAEDQQQYSARKDLAVVEHLMQLTPSSEIVSEVTGKAEEAEKLLAARPLPSDSLEICEDSYDSAAKIYANIAALAGESQTLETAQQINDKLKNVEVLRS
ncbi:MAG: protein kinase domain-containing protein, partial [Planctomycetota bacterium]